MDIHFKICSCQKEKLNLWNELSKNLETFLKRKVNLKLFEKFPQDLEDKVDLFYASFSLSLHLIEKNFKPVAKFKNQKDYYLALSPLSLEKLKEKEHIKVILANRSVFFYLLFYLILSKLSVDFSKIQPVLKDSLSEVEEEILKGSGDIYLLSEKRAKPYLERFSFVEKFPFGVSHYFMVFSKSPLLEDIKNALFSLDESLIKELGFEKIEEVNEWEENFLRLSSLISLKVPEFIEKCTILDTFLNAPFFGIAVYHEKFLYVNPYFCKVLGYTPEEFKSLAVWDIFYYEEDKEKAKKVAERRLKGEYFFKYYPSLILKTKDGRKVDTLVFAGTIFYQNRYCGFIIGVDVTELRKLQKFLNLLRNINQALITCEYEKEIYEKTLPIIYESLNLKGIYLTDKEGKILYSYPEDLKPEEIKTPPYYVYTLSLFKDDKLVLFLNLVSEEKELFTEETEELLKELSADLNFALKKVSLIERDLILRKLTEKVDELLIIADKKGKVEYINSYGIDLLGLKEEEIHQKNCFKLLFIPEELIEKKEDTTRFTVYYKPDKTRVVLELKITFIELAEKVKIVIIGSDLTKELEFERERELLQYQDSLTGLSNRRGFQKKLSELLSILNIPSALILIDFYNFSYINHFYGFEVGDFYLKEISKRLQEVLGDRGLLGRTGGDEFSLFIINVTEVGLAEWIKKVRNVLEDFIFYNDIKISLDWNMGVVVFPQDGETEEILWKKVNLALVEAKKRGPGVIEIYNPEIEEIVEKNFRAELLIKRAITENLFVFYYQPWFETKTLKLAGAKALVRIKNGDKLILPSEFISNLEVSPYLSDFVKLCFEKNLEKIEKWKIPISINLSSQSFKTLDFLNTLAHFYDILSQYPYFLEIEITERTLAENIETAKMIEILKSYKVKVVIDDFGTGYSSLNYLKEFPVDIVKIDKSFIRDMVKDIRTHYIVAIIINLSHFLGMKVVAEGVETEEQFEILKELDCDYVQGFLLSKPLPEEEIEALLKKEKLNKI